MVAPHPRPLILDLELPDEAATAALGRDISALAEPGDVIALFGDLGAGKPTFDTRRQLSAGLRRLHP